MIFFAPLILFFAQSEELLRYGSMALFLLIGGALYFLPSILALYRKHHNTLAIMVLNLLLGWTLLGWIGALIWSLTKTDE